MTSPARLDRCPDCGTPLTNESWAQGVCLSCMARLAIEQPTLHEELQADQRHGRGNASTLDSASAEISPGKILGGRYQIRARLGGGGMGEVWQAFDLKLRVDVALKALHPQLLASERALETLRQEVRTAREVVSPNVCRVYQLEEIEGRELVSMEYVDGHTLAEVLRERSPLPMDEAREIAAQFLAGLEAIHAAELVHRDIKPENVMLTRAGRVVVMDFGVAKILAADETKTVAGTPAYMSPEQALGEALDARADVFSSAILLAEMIAPKGVRAREDRHALWESCRQTPPDLADTPWAPALRSALSPRRDDRPGSAAELSRALEELTVRAAEEGVTPYPGLASFTSENAKFFFGRELEVEEMWKKLRQPHLLALIGPSGAGKSSFVRAGLLAAMPDDWRAVVAQPGNRPFMALGESLVEELAGDTESMRELLRFEEPDVAVSLVSRWRERHGHALIVLDQFEELFTQNPEEVQERFADLLGRLALEADVHVLVSMRDDFFMHCNRHESLRPVFSEVTGLETLSGSGLRRALVQPALRCGYRFEDDALVDEMVSAVEGERGALPLIAFAAAQMWERRDRERGLLTRAAYERIGGVEGALGRHAESTLEKIGEENLPVVRGLFRRLVTAQRTRATWDREELLSAFEDREAASRVLTELIDARLLTSYELDSDGERAATTGRDHPRVAAALLASARALAGAGRGRGPAARSTASVGVDLGGARPPRRSAVDRERLQGVRALARALPGRHELPGRGLRRRDGRARASAAASPEGRGGVCVRGPFRWVYWSSVRSGDARWRRRSVPRRVSWWRSGGPSWRRIRPRAARPVRSPTRSRVCRCTTHLLRGSSSWRPSGRDRSSPMWASGRGILCRFLQMVSLIRRAEVRGGGRSRADFLSKRRDRRTSRVSPRSRGGARGGVVERAFWGSRSRRDDRVRRGAGSGRVLDSNRGPVALVEADAGVGDSPSRLGARADLRASPGGGGGPRLVAE